METKINGAALRALGVAHIEQYFGVWAIMEDTFVSAIDRFESMDVWAHIAECRERAAAGEAQPGAEKPYLTSDGIMVIPISGVMTKYDSSLADASSLRIRKDIRAAVRDAKAKSILLHVDSPGGTVSGTSDLADEVAAAGKIKPVTAYIEDLGASAAYWVSSQANEVYANPGALVGSIGAFTVLTDLSGMAAQRGMKVHVVRAGDFKGMGTSGTEVTGAQLAEAQRIIDGITSQFVGAVAKGRKVGMEKAMSWRDGRVYTATDAKAMGLIDGVESLDVVMERMASGQQRRSPGPRADAGLEQAETEAPPVMVATGKEPLTMADKDEKEKVSTATLSELKAACPGADSDFILAQMEANATVAQAQAAYIAKQSADLKAEREARAAAETKAAQASAEKPGVPPVGAGRGGAAAAEGGEDPSDDPIAQWDAKIAAEMAKPGMTQQKAVRNVVVNNPELHAAYLAAYNAKHGR